MTYYIGLFLIAFASLSLEVALVRLLSVITWYYLAFFAISTAMLGMTAGAVKVYLCPGLFEPGRAPASLGGACLLFALSIPFALCVLCLMPLALPASLISLAGLLFATMACSLPFYFSGIVVSAALTKVARPIGRLYASDLIGAALGCLFALFGMERTDTPSLILLCGCVGALAGAFFAWTAPSPWPRRWSIALFCVLAATSAGNARAGMRGIQPLMVKNRFEPAYDYFLEHWNSFTRVAVYPCTFSAPQYWGPSPSAPMASIP
ncbi:MAG: hypothetical protein NTW86_05670, partial [Candidatus Sumerlaeota bacterium]|nr:hypothetical protein [Candidatus Sumerlaeota bacterium]